MGTRGAVGFLVNGEKKLTYNHFDSYPGGLGIDTLHWLQNHLVVTDEFAVTVSPEVLGQLHDLAPVEETARPTEEQQELLRSRGFLPQNVSTGQDWYAWLRDCQGDLTATIKSGFIIEANDFPLDSLFCEWAYVINVDTGEFEVYEGFQKTVPTAGLWAGQDVSISMDYKPVHLVKAWPFKELPDLTDEQFLDILDVDEDEEEGS